MERPFYVYTPRNIFGQNLVKDYNDVCYEIKSQATPDKTYTHVKDFIKAKDVAKTLNDSYEIGQAYAMHI